MADLKQLGIKVEQQGVQAAANALNSLATRANAVVAPLKAMKEAMVAADAIRMSALVKSLETVSDKSALMKKSLSGLNDLGNGFKGISNSFTAVATAAEKVGNSVGGITAFNAQLVELKSNLSSIKDVSGTLGSIKVGSVSVRTTSSPRAAVSNADTQTNEAYTASQKRLIAQLEREALQVGKTRAEYLAARAAKLGISEVAAPYIAQLQKATTTSDKYVMSQRELSAAMRNVPAQFTDIATQLAGGQSPFLIMLQQGGQLRDMFHGFGPMFRNVGGMIAKFLMNPFVLAAAAIAGFTTAVIFGAKETEDFNKSVALTGNYSGITTQKFLELQKSLASVGVAKSDVAEALTAVATSGLRAGNNIEGLTKTIIDFSKRSGESIADIVAEYKSLEKDPVQAILTLNDKYHFLTVSTYQHITALMKQGEQTKAVALAEAELEKAHKSMAGTIVSNAGTMQNAWAGLLGLFSKVKNAILEVGRPASLTELQARLAAVNKQIASGGKQTFVPGMGMTSTGDTAELQAEKLKLEQEINKAKATQATQQRNVNVLTEEQRKNMEAINSLIDQGNKKSHSQLAMKQELAALDKKIASVPAGTFSQSQIEAARKAIRDQYEDKGAANKTSSINTELQQILEATRAYKAETAQLNQLGLTFDKTGEARKKLNAYQAEVSSGKASEDRLKLLRTLIPALKEEADAEDANKKAKSSWDEAKQIHEKSLSITSLLEAQKDEIAILESTGSTQTKVSENERQSILLKKKAAEATDSRIATIMNEAAALYGEAAANEKVIKSLTEVNNLKSRGAARQEAGKSELDTLKEQLAQGDVTDSRKLARTQDYEEQKKINALIKEQNDARAHNNQAAVEEIQTQIEYEQKLREEKKKTIDQYDSEKGSLTGMMDSAKRAWDDFIGSSKSSEQDLHSMFSSTFSTMTDTFTTFCETGKLNFKSMTVSILKNIEAMLVKWVAMRAIMGLASYATSLFGGTSTTAASTSTGSGLTGTISTPGLVFGKAHGDAFTSSGIHKFAQGGTFTNGIYNSPTFFKFANGGSFSNGVLGEKGNEAVMPLGRTSSGDLGVKVVNNSSNTSGNTTIQIVTNVYGSSSDTSTPATDSSMKQMSEGIGVKIKQTLIDEMKPNGLLAKFASAK